jgi:hypothetical protein
MTLAKWAGWTDQSDSASGRTTSGTFLARRVLELDEVQRAEILNHIEEMLRERRT